MRKTLTCLLLAGGLLAPWAGPAADERSREDDPAELTRQGVATLMRALEAMIDSIPQYEMPELLDNGDIIIRRVNPPEPRRDEDPAPEIDETET